MQSWSWWIKYGLYVPFCVNYLAEEVDVGQVSTGVLVDVKEVGAWHVPRNRLTETYHGLGQILQKIYGGYH